MEPIRVWYQVNTPGAPYPTIFVPPPENQLMLWNVSDGPWYDAVKYSACGCGNAVGLTSILNRRQFVYWSKFDHAYSL